MIAHKANGECVYLGENGCTIHDRAPSLCRVVDCRTLAARVNFETARQMHLMGRLNLAVWDQGNKLLQEERRKAGNPRPPGRGNSPR